VEPLEIEYKFKLPDKSEKSFKLQLNPRTVEIVRDNSSDLPEWTKLEFHKCPNCLFKSGERIHCPAAACLVDMVTSFNRLVSFDAVKVEVITSERHISHHTTAQQGISSLMGLLIAASGCPRTAYFKPMARFHLPLSEPEETMYRATSMYLLAQYFLNKRNRECDLDLKGLAEIYRNLQIVNNSLAERIRAASQTDSSVNALILLDLHAKTLSYVLDDYLDELEHMFAAYF